MTKRPHTDWTTQEVSALSDEALRRRRSEAQLAEARADAPGMGRSTKGRRMWRKNRELVEAEMASRGPL